MTRAFYTVIDLVTGLGLLALAVTVYWGHTEGKPVSAASVATLCIVLGCRVLGDLCERLTPKKTQ